MVQQVLYLIFNEGYVASAGEALQRTDLAAEGIRLARLMRCAMVASGTTNARAISAVLSPPTARKVSATWEDGLSAG